MRRSVHVQPKAICLLADLSPIEKAFSDLKMYLRREGARTHETFFEAIAAALFTVTAADARGWFTHCGYPTPISSEPLTCSDTDELIVNDSYTALTSSIRMSRQQRRRTGRADRSELFRTGILSGQHNGV